jgi:hypothetical protein
VARMASRRPTEGFVGALNFGLSIRTVIAGSEADIGEL